MEAEPGPDREGLCASNARDRRSGPADGRPNPVILYQLVTQLLESSDQLRHAVVVDGTRIVFDANAGGGHWRIRNRQCGDP
jgi:hypothetical protein